MRDPCARAHLRALRCADRRARAGEGRPDVLLRPLRRGGGRHRTARSGLTLCSPNCRKDLPRPLLAGPPSDASPRSTHKSQRLRVAIRFIRLRPRCGRRVSRCVRSKEPARRSSSLTPKRPRCAAASVSRCQSISRLPADPCLCGRLFLFQAPVVRLADAAAPARLAAAGAAAPARLFAAVAPPAERPAAGVAAPARPSAAARVPVAALVQRLAAALAPAPSAAALADAAGLALLSGHARALVARAVAAPPDADVAG